MLTFILNTRNSPWLMGCNGYNSLRQENHMLRDTYNRPVRDLRISVTDRCNFRCIYCMPLDEYEWL